MRVYERSLVPDSEGAGRQRGTVASRVEYGPIGCQMRVIFSTDSTRYPPRGARGGLSPTPARHCKRALSGNLSELDPVSDLLLESGESVIGVSCGGGGYGSPLDRDSTSVKRDVDEGYVSRERAESVYGVVFDANGEVDQRATREGRKTRA